jgi:2-methylisocitrate lyase-like PEP mutase family enzyme
MKSSSLFRKYILDDDILVLPVVHDALCALIAEKSGFSAICSAGYANSAAMLGKPDVSLLTMTEMVECTGRIVESVSIPVFADADTGYGNAINVIRTVRLFERAGAAGILLEDQVQPKRCGHMSGKQVIPAEEMVAKIEAALDSRSDPDFTILARTDSLAVHGIDDAIARAKLYRECGADMIFVEAPESVAQMKRIVNEVDAPHLANMIPGGRTPVLSARQLQDIGYAAVAYPTLCTYAIASSVRGVFSELAQTGSLPLDGDALMDFDEFNSLVELEDIRKKERHYYRYCR